MHFKALNTKTKEIYIEPKILDVNDEYENMPYDESGLTSYVPDGLVYNYLSSIAIQNIAMHKIRTIA